MKKFFIGDNPLTSIAGILLGAGTIAYQLYTKGNASFADYAFGIGLYILGRLAGDSNK